MSTDPTLPWWGWTLYGLVCACFVLILIYVLFVPTRTGDDADEGRDSDGR